jgi:hypothetical protein
LRAAASGKGPDDPAKGIPVERRLLPTIVLSLVLALGACSTGTSTASGGDTTATTSTTAPSTTTTAPSTTAAPTTTAATTTIATTTTTSAPSTTTTPPSSTTEPSVSPIGQFTEPPVQSDGFPAAPGPTALLADLRHAPHDGFERVVYEFREADALAYRLEYVEAAVPPSGDPIVVGGEVILQVVMTPASGYDFTGGSLEEVYEGPDRLSPADSELVAEMVLVEDFEGTLVWAIGLRARHRVAAGILEDPLRLVVDIAAG